MWLLPKYVSFGQSFGPLLAVFGSPVRQFSHPPSAHDTTRVRTVDRRLVVGEAVHSGLVGLEEANDHHLARVVGRLGPVARPRPYHDPIPGGVGIGAVQLLKSHCRSISCAPSL